MKGGTTLAMMLFKEKIYLMTDDDEISPPMTPTFGASKKRRGFGGKTEHGNVLMFWEFNVIVPPGV